MKKIIVDKKYDNKKLSKIILEVQKEIHYPMFCKLLRKKDIKINGKRINKDITVYENDEIILYTPEIQEQDKKIEIIYEDDNILVVNKDIGIEVTGEESLTNILQKQYQKQLKFLEPCHRIDRNTRGLVVFAKTKEVLEIMLKKFKNHEIEKHYLAVVYGIPEEKKKRVESFLFKDNKKARVYIKDTFEKGYKKIITTYTVLEERNDNTALLDVEIETGRTHQIRVHLAQIGYPVIGDTIYSSGKNKWGIVGQCLHAKSLKFRHPTTHEEMWIQSELPDYFKNVLKELDNET